MSIEGNEAGRSSRLLLLLKEMVAYRPAERPKKFLCRCFELYWEKQQQTSDGLFSFEDLFPTAELIHIAGNSFLSDIIISRVIELIDSFERKVNRLYTYSQHIEDAEALKALIADVLEAYYRLFWWLLKDADLIFKELNTQKDISHQAGMGYVFLQRVLALGCVFKKECAPEGATGVVTPFAPRYLSAILELSNLITGIEEKKDADTVDQIADTHAEVLGTFVSRFVRWFMTAPDGTLCHAAIRNITSLPEEWTDICLTIRPIEKYSSFEGINGLRIFEKIKYELEQRSQEPDDAVVRWESLNVLIAGDLDAEQAIRFGRMLEGWLNSDMAQPADEQAVIWFLLYTDNPSFQPEMPEDWSAAARSLRRVRFQSFGMQELFRDPRSLRKQVERADMLLFLDCRQLYNDFHADPCPNLNAFFQQTAHFSLSATHSSVSGHILSPNNPFFQMQDLLVGAAYNNCNPAILKKDVNTAKFDFIKRQLSAQRKTTYFYYSDLSAASDLYWREDCFMRAEEYAGKNMVILRYGAREEPPLPLAGDGKKIIVFNLWQFIKHSNLHMVDSLMEGFHLCNGQSGSTVESLHLLLEILIGIDYSDWPKTIELTYTYPAQKELFSGAGFTTALTKYLETIIVPCFDRKSSSIYNSYFRKCIASFLFSDAKTVDDMLFIHIFKKHFDLLRSVNLAREENYKKLLELQAYQLKKIKYSGKRFYREVISDYDEPFRYVPNQHRKLSLMEESGKLSPVEVFQKICSACEANQYANSDLFRNCTRWLAENGGL